MCGITGAINSSLNMNLVVPAMNKLLSHRGPDDSGYTLVDEAALGHTRLAIIDLKSGIQPMMSADKRFCITYNGEVFNYIELRHELRQCGYQFKTDSDTEVVLVSFQHWGLDCIRKFNGQFAFAVWDSFEKKLVMARDRVGICPLFYQLKNRSLYFASEIKALLPCQNESLKIDRQALDAIFTFWSPLPGTTIFKNIQSVKPGHCLTFCNGQLEDYCYWDFTFPNGASGFSNRSEAQLTDELTALLNKSTSLRLRADVPVAAYLSGGLDSSVITTLIHDIKPNNLRTFSLEFSEKDMDESRYQQELIRQIESQHTSHLVNPEHIAENFVNTIWHAESPILRTAPTPMSLLSGHVQSQNYKVVLTGEGADEVLGGYDLFKETKIRQFWAKYPESKWRPLLLKKLYPYLTLPDSGGAHYLKSFFGEGLNDNQQFGFSHLLRWSSTSKAKRFFSQQTRSEIEQTSISQLQSQLPSDYNNWHWLNKAQYLELKTLMAGYLLSSQGDRMLMSHSVEGRFPYLDNSFIDFSSTLPASLKMKVLNEKYLLKRAMFQKLPDSIINRYKQPYRAPDVKSLTDPEMPEWVCFLLSPSEISRMDYFNSTAVSMLVKKANTKKQLNNSESQALVGILSTQLLHQLFIDRKQGF